MPSVRRIAGVGPAEQILRGRQAELAQHQPLQRRLGPAPVGRAGHGGERGRADAVAVAGVAQERAPAA